MELITVKKDIVSRKIFKMKRLLVKYYKIKMVFKLKIKIIIVKCLVSQI